MVHWVYVLRSSETGAIYVGETTRLYRRWNEHQTGRGGVTTSQGTYDTLIGLYHVGHNWQFLTYRPDMLAGNYNYRLARYWDDERDKGAACDVENHLTERYRLDTKPFWLVKGGKYCRENQVCDMTSVIRDRPLCACGYPCEVKLKKDETKLYFVCPVPDWIAFEDMIVPKPCKFWEEFQPYRSLREARASTFVTAKRDSTRRAFLEMTTDEFTTYTPALV